MRAHGDHTWYITVTHTSEFSLFPHHGSPCLVMAVLTPGRYKLDLCNLDRDARVKWKSVEAVSDACLPPAPAHIYCSSLTPPTTREMVVRRRCDQSHVVVVVATLSCLLLHTSSQSLPNTEIPSGETVTEDPVWDIRHILPEANLENNTVTDVTANVGDVAHLPCRFPQLSTLHQAFLLLQVSWIRRWDWHILTTGIYTYTSDMRFSVLHPEGSDDWTLQIKYAETRDNGTYECQMYTGTGVLSQFVNVHVNTPRAAILGPQELHVQEGDTITLICVIQQSKPPFVFWYHGENMVNYDGNRHRLNVITKVEGTRTHSRLTITDARSWDSGNYSCIPPNVEPSYVLVFVTEAGDTVAAVQRRGHSSTAADSTSSAVRLVATFCVCWVAFFAHLLPVR
ncbi:uncharacterized protein LOC121857720 isoform X2 [Homarus americanus]|uniref:uncharacterized protein LOC121857720 isoform X2 n=1 Tax=Homarus americanus TaxID=6706 RepID=UPI001C441DA7|nr:uncharacterized protein LOC121857720 isoform X2 [Homarus americanus]